MHKKPRGKAKKMLLFAGILVLCGLALAAGAVFVLAQSLPSVEQISSREIAQSTKIYDRTGTVLLYEASQGTKRTVIPFDEIPQSLKDATVSIEDENFYTEPAFDWRGIARAIYVDLRTGSFAQGASTITQQLARNAFLTTEKSVTRKIKEIILAIELNREYSKDQILGFYLNEVPYGPTVYGVESASEAYFGKPVKDISLAQAAVLAALPKGPTYYSPWGSHVDELMKRQRIVLDKMLELGKITKKEHDRAAAEKIVFQPQSKGILAPHFVIAVEDYLAQKYGEDALQKGGLRVVTTLDWGLEQAAEKAVKEGAETNQRLYSGYNASLVAEDPKTGQILAMVGSRDYFATSSLPAGCTPGANCKFEPNFNVATQGLRQPGSSLKPFVYLTAFQKGYTPDTVLFDVPTEFAANNPSCPPVPDYNNDDPHCFHPEDFDPFMGPISMRTALAQSVNVAAVKTLYLVGLKDALTNANGFGLTTLSNPNLYGLSLVLGGGAVHLIDLAGAYSTLAADGIHHDQTMVLEVKDSSGNVLESYADKSARVADAQSVRLINNILSDPAARSGLFQNSLNLTVFPGFDVALKTGTSNDYHDAWTSGYTPALEASVWAGNNDNTPMQRNGSSLLAAVPIWHAFMAQALQIASSTETFINPDPVTAVKLILRGDYTAGNQIHSILWSVDRANPAGPPPANPADDPQFTNWETGVLGWATIHIPNFQTFNQTSTPIIQNSSGTVISAPRIAIQEPTAGEYVQNQINISARIMASAPIQKIRVYLNGALIQDFGNISFGTDYPFNWSFVSGAIKPQNLLEIEAVDQNNLSTKVGVIVYGQGN